SRGRASQTRLAREDPGRDPRRGKKASGIITALTKLSVIFVPSAVKRVGGLYARHPPHLVLFLQRLDGVQALAERPASLDARGRGGKRGDAGDAVLNGGAADVGVVVERFAA